MKTAIVQLPTYVESRVQDAILPVEYTAACRAVAACRTIDESKHWSDKADALAAWAKIYKNEQAAVEAKRLKLHAYRRMSVLADELQPKKQQLGPHGGSKPGPRALLLGHGFSREVTKYIRRVGAIPQSTFDEMIRSPKPPGISAASEAGVGHAKQHGRMKSSEAWRRLSIGHTAGGVNLRRFITIFCRKNSAKELARSLNPGEVKAVRALLNEAQEWLDELEQYLPKAPLA